MVRISRSHRDGRGSIPRLGMFSTFLFKTVDQEYHKAIDFKCKKRQKQNVTLYWTACDVATQLMRDKRSKKWIEQWAWKVILYAQWLASSTMQWINELLTCLTKRSYKKKTFFCVAWSRCQTGARQYFCAFVAFFRVWTDFGCESRRPRLLPHWLNSDLHFDMLMSNAQSAPLKFWTDQLVLP